MVWCRGRKGLHRRSRRKLSSKNTRGRKPALKGVPLYSFHMAVCQAYLLEKEKIECIATQAK